MNSCCVTVHICQCCGNSFSKHRPRSPIVPHNCEPCVTWGQVECPAPRVEKGNKKEVKP